MVRNYCKIGSKWWKVLYIIIIKKSGEKIFVVKIADGQVWKRHVFLKEGIDYDYDHLGIEHSSGISAKTD